MLVNPTVPQLLRKAENRYRLVIATSKRARQLSNGAKPLSTVEQPAPISIAAEEIYENKVTIYDKAQWDNLIRFKKEGTF